MQVMLYMQEMAITTMGTPCELSSPGAMDLVDVVVDGLGGRLVGAMAGWAWEVDQAEEVVLHQDGPSSEFLFQVRSRTSKVER